MIKLYRGVGSAALVEHLSAQHAAYVRALRAAGVLVPDTEMHVIRENQRYYPVVVQDLFRDDELLRNVIAKASLEQAKNLLVRCLEIIAAFWKAAENEVKTSNLGFHASIRNFGFRQDKLWFLDTFPPLIGFDQPQMHRLVLTFAQNRWCRILGPLALPFMSRVSDDWYSAIECLEGAIGSACRLRPDDAQQLLATARQFARSRLEPPAAAALLGKLDRPPRLSATWTTLRSLMGKEGKPNVPASKALSDRQ